MQLSFFWPIDHSLTLTLFGVRFLALQSPKNRSVLKVFAQQPVNWISRLRCSRVHQRDGHMFGFSGFTSCLFSSRSLFTTTTAPIHITNGLLSFNSLLISDFIMDGKKLSFVPSCLLLSTAVNCYSHLSLSLYTLLVSYDHIPEWLALKIPQQVQLIQGWNEPEKRQKELFHFAKTFAPTQCWKVKICRWAL